MDAIACVGRQHVLYGLPPSAMQETGILGARHWEAPNIPVCSTCFVHPCHGPSPEEEVGPLLPLPEQDDLSMSHLQHGMDPVSGTGNSAQLAAAWFSTSLTQLGQGTFLTEAFKGKAWVCYNFACSSCWRTGCSEQKRVGLVKICFSHSWWPLRVCTVCSSGAIRKAAGAVSSFLAVLAVTQREILVHWCLSRVWVAEDYCWNLQSSASHFTVRSCLAFAWVVFSISHEILKYLLHQHLLFLTEVYSSFESLENTTPKPFAWAEWHAEQLMNQHSCVKASQQWIQAKIEATSGEHANPSCARDEIQRMLGWIAGFSRLSLIKS